MIRRTDLTQMLAMTVVIHSILYSAISARSDEIANLTFSLIVSFGENGFNSSGTIPAVEIALEHINNDPSVLKGYKLQHSPPRNSKCNRVASLDSFFQDIVTSDQTKIAVLGCGCSVATEPVAEISHRWNISQISFASASSSLSDRTRFKGFFRDYPTFEALAPAVLAVLNEYGWNRIAFLTQNENVFNKLYSDFKLLTEGLTTNKTDLCCFNQVNITIGQALFETNMDPVPAVAKAFESDFRVFFLNSYSNIASEVIARWWTKDVNKLSIDCPDNMMEDFVEKSRAIVIRQLPVPDNISEITQSGYSSDVIDDEYRNRITNKTYGNFLPNIASALAYDAVWILALGLNQTQQLLHDNTNEEIDNITGCRVYSGNLTALENFSYTNGYMGCVMRWSLSQTNFTGASGQIKFDENGTVIQDKLPLLQYRRYKNEDTGMEEVERVRFGFVNGANNFSLHYDEQQSQKSVYPAGPPPDGTPNEVIRGVKRWLIVIYYTCAFMGLICAICCSVFNFIFRKRKVIQLTSPNLNYIIVTGSALMYMSVYFGVFPSTSEAPYQAQCIVYPWLFIGGYLFAFGTILAKTWRVYQIFHNPSPTKIIPLDYHLLLGIMCISGVGIALLIIRSATQTSLPVVVPDKEQKEGETELGIREIYSVLLCHSSTSPAYYIDIVVMVYLITLQLVGLVICFQTRKVKITALNDSKFVAAIVYISSIVLVMLFLVTFALRGFINITAGIIVGGVILMASIFLGLTFIPRIIQLYNDPNGERIFTHVKSPISLPADVKPASASSCGTTAINNSTVRESVLSSPGKEDSESIGLLQRKTMEQEKQLRDKDVIISELTLKLGMQ